MATLAEVLAAAESAFREAGFPNASHEARYLVCAHLSCSPTALFVRQSETLPSDLAGFIRDQVSRRVRREPADYLIGWKEFRGRRFGVNPAVLIPRPETEDLAGLTIEECGARGGGPRVLDIGTGSGCIAVSVALEAPGAEVTAVDVSEPALALARANAEALKAPTIRFFRSDLFAGLPPDSGGNFDIIVSNPPYIPTDAIRSLEPELAFEPDVALDGGEDGLSVIRRIAAESPFFLKPGGRLLLEVGFDQGRAVAEILSSQGFRSIDVRTDLEGRERIVTGDMSGPV